MALGVMSLFVIAAVLAVVIILVPRQGRAAVVLVAAAVIGVLVVTAGLPFVHRVRPSVNERQPRTALESAITPGMPDDRQVDAPRAMSAARPGVAAIAAPDDFTPGRKNSALIVPGAQAPGKDWVESAAGAQYVREAAGGIDFIYWKPGGDTLAGYSDLETTAAEARRAAEESAVQKVAVLGLHAAMKTYVGAYRHGRSTGDLRALAARLAGETGCVAIEDSVTQEIARPYGNLYRVAVLVRIDPQRTAMLADDIVERIRSGHLADQTRTRVFVLAAAGLIVCIVGFFAAYCLIRAGAAGVLAWPLRVVALMVLAFLGVAVYLLSARGM